MYAAINWWTAGPAGGESSVIAMVKRLEKLGVTHRYVYLAADDVSAVLAVVEDLDRSWKVRSFASGGMLLEREAP